MTTADNSRLGAIPIRRGFWDSSFKPTDIGWGMDKAWNKHNIWSVEAMRRVMISTNITPEGNQAVLRAYAGKYRCVSQSCTLVDQRELKGIYDSVSYDTYYGWPAGGKLAMKTLYCEQGGVWKCPTWVTFAITNPGVNNPYGNGAFSPSITGDPDDARTESGLDPAKARSQAETLASPEIIELAAGIAAGEQQVGFSFEPLPAQVHIP